MKDHPSNLSSPPPSPGGSEEFLHLLTHDLAAPVRTLVTYLEFFRNDWGGTLSPEAEQDLAKVERSARKVHQMLEDLRTFSRASRCRPDFRPTNLARCIEWAVSQEREALTSIDAAVEAPEGLPDLTTDESILSLILRELLRNAVRYRCPDRKLAIRISTEAGEDGVLLEVADNGAGIESLRPGVLFEPLKKGPNSPAESTGIGLACCRRWAECLGATIAAQPNPSGFGTLFTIRFPAAKQT